MIVQNMCCFWVELDQRCNINFFLFWLKLFLISITMNLVFRTSLRFSALTIKNLQAKSLQICVLCREWKSCEPFFGWEKSPHPSFFLTFWSSLLCWSLEAKQLRLQYWWWLCAVGRGLPQRTWPPPEANASQLRPP